MILDPSAKSKESSDEKALHGAIPLTKGISSLD